MIESKDDLKYYLACDEFARWGKHVPFYRKISTGAIWSFHRHLRKLEFAMNSSKGIIRKVACAYHKYILKQLNYKLGWSIGPNTFGPGLCIVHPGTVVVNANVRAGAFCRIHVCVNIGANAGETDTPKLGDYVYIGPGAKIFGNIEIASNVAIGANAVVNKSFATEGVTIGGIPAKVISQQGTEKMIKRFP